VLKNSYPKDIYDVPQTISWKDKSKECCVWSENMMQNNTLKKIYSLENMVLTSNNELIINMWGRLQAAEYFYYMADCCSTATHKYLNPYLSPQEAYQYFTNIMTDLEISLIRNELGNSKRIRIPLSFMF
jgi:alpha-amylase